MVVLSWSKNEPECKGLDQVECVKIDSAMEKYRLDKLHCEDEKFEKLKSASKWILAAGAAGFSYYYTLEYAGAFGLVSLSALIVSSIMTAGAWGQYFDSGGLDECIKRSSVKMDKLSMCKENGIELSECFK